MNYNIDVYTRYDINEKIVIPRKNYYCSNCNKRGHIYKKCNESIISNGIISFYIDDFNISLLPLLQKYILDNINKKCILQLNNNNNRIKFLMVQRKHSLGYLEFIRGKYEPDNIKIIKHLLEQMTFEEIYNLKNKEFDILWKILWGDIDFAETIKSPHHYKEYISSKQKFYELKINNHNLFNTINPNYDYNEWGFPKGRRELYESDVVCAMREFEEETNFKELDYTLISDTHYVIEDLIGTNGINYKHNYFLSLIYKDNILNDKTNKEIGDIKIMDLETCLKLIRPYHHKKIYIIKKIYNLINNFLIEYE